MRNQILQSKRLKLISAKKEDFGFLYKNIFSQIDIMRYLTGKVLCKDEALKLFNKDFIFDNSKIGLGLIVEKESEKIVGFAGVEEFEDGFDFGYVLVKKFWGKGYATEIAKAQIDFLKQNYPNSPIYATAHPKNYASMHILEKLGLECIAVKELARGLRAVYKL